MGRSRDAELVARAFLDQFGLDWIGRKGTVLQAIGLDVQEVDRVSFDGALVRVANFNRGRIAIRRDIREEGRKLFTIAHEVGHYILPQHGLEASLCRSREIQSWSLTLRTRELEANAFAAEILLPREVVLPLTRLEPSMSHISDIASKRGTSLTASAVRYVELSDRRLALVLSRAGEVEWCRSASEFKRGVPQGRVDRHSVAGRLFAGGSGPDGFEEVPAITWLHDANLREDATILEWSRALPFYGSVLTLLFIQDSVEVRPDLDEEPENELDPGEFTLQRRRWPGKR